MLRGFIRHVPRSSVRGHRRDALQPCSTSSVGEDMGRFDGLARSRVVEVDLLEQVKDHLSALRCVAGNHAHFVHRELEVGS